jgi:hypothetical protein
VRSVGYHPRVVDQLGEICWRMGDVPAAGRFWFFTVADTDVKRTSIETFLSLGRAQPSVIVSQLPRKLRQTRLDRFPTEVQQRLRTLIPAADASHTLEEVARRRTPMTLSDLLISSVALLITLFFLYCFSVGLAQILQL